MLKNIWASKNIRITTKLRILNSNVKCVLLYGAETWRVTKATLQKIQTFYNTGLRRIFHIRWPERISNEELWKRVGREPMDIQIRQRKCGWIGHTLRKSPSSITRQALTWNPQGKRKRGRPTNSWRRDSESELKTQDMTWHDAAKQLRIVFVGGLLLMAYVPHGAKGLRIEIPDNQGKEFIIGYMEANAFDGQVSKKPVDLFITTSSATPVDVEISTPKYGNNVEKIIVTPDKVEHVQLRKELRLHGNMRCNNGVLIKGNKEIIVFGLNVADASTDGFMALPVDVLGTKYYVPAYRNNAHFVNYFKTAILVVGVEDNTNLSIKLSVGGNVEVEVDGKKFHDGDWINTTINRFETLHIVTSGDLTGTFILTSSPVSVFGGSTVTTIGSGRSRDHVEEHIPPVNVWGKTFFINPIPNTDDNIFRFLSSQDNTELMVNNNKYVLQKSGYFLETRLQGFSVVTSNKPILSVLYVPSPTDRSKSGDPAMALIPPREQFNSFYSFATPVSSRNAEFSTVFVFVIEIKDKNGIVLDGKPVSMSQIKGLVPHDSFSAGYLEIPPGSHTLKHSSVIAKFSGILYGGANKESYCFPVGQRFAQINEVRMYVLH
ncbi:uncharacterized protein LOC134276660 [Saccostrea cucullata]|uniref:uncharacterized protein LOC134276660 n=1 Tax=Saccostrea cuccullata TaxID=36930 RepID=UPI002ED342A9